MARQQTRQEGRRRSSNRNDNHDHDDHDHDHGHEEGGKGRVAKMFGDEEKRVKDRIERGYMPFRFWQERGESCEITILDASLDDGFARPEHNLQGADGKWGNIVPCIRNEAQCPNCKEKDGAVVLYLTALVHRPYTKKKTGEVIPQSRMFLCLKRGQYNDFARIEKAALKKYGTLRGVTLKLERDNDDNSFSTGMPVPGEDGNLIIDFYKEKELEDEFGNDEVTNRETRKVIKKENEDIMPYDYRKLMPPPDIDEYMAEYGGGRPTPGSRQAHDKYRDDDEGDEIPMSHEGDRRRRRSGGDDDDDGGDQGSRRRRRSGSDEDGGDGEGQGSRRRRRSGSDEGGDGDGDGDGGSRRRRSKPDPEPEPEPEPERGRRRSRSGGDEGGSDKAARSRRRSSSSDEPNFDE